MHRQTPIHLALGLAMTACNYVNNLPGGGDETGGLVDGPPEIENPPQWVCAERVPDLTLPGDDESLVEQETCAYVPHIADGTWPGKPYWKGIPNFFGLIPHDIEDGNFPMLLGETIVDPIHTWLLSENPDDYYELHHQSPDHPTLPATLADFRSGLIGNFAIWVGGVPDDHPRPPIVTASLLGVFGDLITIVGHPFYSGRYNAVGIPCSTNPPNASSFTPTDWGTSVAWNVDDSPHAECQALIDAVGIHEIAPAYPHAVTLQGQHLTNAKDAARCLSNEGVYTFAGALQTAGTRNGLVWLNWGSETWEEFKQWVLAAHPELEALLVALDFLEGTGWDLWPLDPDYPYSRWSYTGVCSHSARLDVVNGQPRTVHGCPHGMMAVLPEFDLPLDGPVQGYCTLPFTQSPPPGVADTTPIDIIMVGKPGHGFTGARYVNIDGLSPTRLREWSSAIRFTEHTGGIRIEPVNDLGVDLLEAFGVPQGSTLLTINAVAAYAEADGSPGASSIELAIEVDRAVMASEIIMATIDTLDGRRLHRYIVPVAHFQGGLNE